MRFHNLFVPVFENQGCVQLKQQFLREIPHFSLLNLHKKYTTGFNCKFSCGCLSWMNDVSSGFEQVFAYCTDCMTMKGKKTLCLNSYVSYEQNFAICWL